MSDEAAGQSLPRSRPFVNASRRPDIISKLATRAASQPPATTAAAIAAQAAHPRSAAAKNWLLQRAESSKESSGET